MIREFARNGMKIKRIAEKIGISRPKVRKYLNARKPPEHSRKRRKSKLDPYREYIRERLEKYDLSAVRILEKIKKKGYDGSYTILKDYCRTLRKDRTITAVYCYETEPGKQSQVVFGECAPSKVDSHE